jgi:peptide/nickel transport system permease protein
MRKAISHLDFFTKVCFFWLVFVGIIAAISGFLPLVNPTDFDLDAVGVGLFSPGHLLGTDSNGYDLLSNVVNGARISLLIAIVSVGIGGSIGSAIGIIAGFRRGKIDSGINLVFNILLSIPNLVLGLALVAVLATSPDASTPVPSSRRIIVIIFSLTVVIIPILGRIARAATLTWVNREFVLAARSMGMRDKDIIWKHIVPNVLPAIYAVAFLAVGVVIVAEGSLALLGVGITEGVSWGGMIARVAGEFTYAPQSMYVPVAVLAFTVISCNQPASLSLSANSSDTTILFIFFFGTKVFA